MSYILGMMEKDFNEDIHLLTGLFDKYERPIVREKFSNEKHFPLGFGRYDEWRILEQSFTSPDTRVSS